MPPEIIAAAAGGRQRKPAHRAARRDLDDDGILIGPADVGDVRDDAADTPTRPVRIPVPVPPAVPVPPTIGAQPDVAVEVLHLADSIRGAVGGVLLGTDRRLTGHFRIAARPDGAVFPTVHVAIEIREKTPTAEIDLPQLASDSATTPATAATALLAPAMANPAHPAMTDAGHASTAQASSEPTNDQGERRRNRDLQRRGRRRAVTPRGIRGLLY